MTINLEAILNKKQETKQSGERFLFESVGDQLVFKFLSRRTVKTARGDDSDLVEVEALGGTKLDKKSKQSVPVQPGKYVFFLPLYSAGYSMTSDRLPAISFTLVSRRLFARKTT
jgi:hypothetical protein